MRSRFSRLTAVAVALCVMGTLLTGCGGTKTTIDSSSTSTQVAEQTADKVQTPELVTLKFYLPGDAVNNMQTVLDEFYNKTKDTLNTKLEFVFVPFAELTTTMPIKIAAAEQIDSVFDAPWATMNQNIAKNVYQNLDSYMFNDQYPGLKKAFPENYINSNKFVDSTGNMSVYGLPFTHNYAYAKCLIIRKDLRVKYGIGEIKSLEDLQVYYEAVLKNEGGKIIPFAGGPSSPINDIISPMLKTKEVYKDVTYVQAGIQFDVVLKDGKAQLYLAGDDYTGVPGEVYGGPFFVKSQHIAKEWYSKGYTEKDVMTQKDPAGVFKAGKFASVTGDSGQIVAITSDLKKAVPGAETEMIALDPKIVNPTPESLKTDYKAWNFQCIPSYSENTERVMKVYDAIFADENIHDLFEFGIKGKNWDINADNSIKTLTTDEKQAYNFPGFALTWNPAMIKYPDTYTPDVIKIEKVLSDINYFYKDPLAGFSFNAEPVKSELAKVVPELQKYSQVLGNGLSKDPVADMKKMMDSCNKLGLQKIRDEATKQINDWLAKQAK